MLPCNPGLLAGGVFLDSEIPMTSPFKAAPTLAVAFSLGIWLFCCSMPGFLSQSAGTFHGAGLGNAAWLCSVYSLMLCLMKLQLSCESEPTPKLIDLWVGKNHSFMVLWCQCPNPEQTKGDGPKNTFSSRRVVLGLFLCCFLQWAFCWPLFAVLLSAEDWQIPPLLWTSQCESGFKINVLKKCQAGLGADIAWVWISLFTTRAGSVHALLSVCPPLPFQG